MFIYNFKVNGSKIFKYFFTGIVVLIICILIFVSIKLFVGAKNNRNISSCMPQSDVSVISAKNYTNVLKAVHENIDDYVGIKIQFTGYVYRVLDLTDTQFILARDMIISSDFQYVIVGFLCEYENAQSFANETWVELTGEITKGNYHGDMPIVKVTEMKTVDKPNEEYVYPPDDTYIPTSGVV